MFDTTAYFLSLGVVLAFAICSWLLSVIRRDVSLVDSLWSLMILLSLGIYLISSSSIGPRGAVVMVLVAVWALRLSIYITVRNHGQPEDRRYQAIRNNNQPRFWLKSLYIVFLLQGFLAWVVSLSAVAAVAGQAPLGPLDYAGITLWICGMFFESVGDWQLARFRRSETTEGQVLDSGLWRYTRHPNYFGEAVLWWGIYLLALSAGAWWSVFAPLLMTVLLLRVSGVSLLEKDIADRRPAYRQYISQTNAFFPGRPRRKRAESSLNGG